MKVLQISISGYMELDDDATFDFVVKKGSKKPMNANEVVKEGDFICLPSTTIVVGNNASGKSCVISLFLMCYYFLANGRLPYKDNMFRNKDIHLTILFAEDNEEYKYECTIIKPDYIDAFNVVYCGLSNQKIYSRSVVSSYEAMGNRKKFKEVKLVSIHERTTMSIIKQLPFGVMPYFAFKDQSIPVMGKQLYQCLEYLGKEVGLRILSMFDLGIANYNMVNDENFEFVLADGRRATKSIYEFGSFISYGSIRAALLIAQAFVCLEQGSSLFIDEIEKSIHLDYARFVIKLFNNKDYNHRNARLVFSTFSPDLLDIIKRSDNILIAYKNSRHFVSVLPFSQLFSERIRVNKSKIYRESSFYMRPDINKLKEIATLIKDFGQEHLVFEEL